MKKIKLLLLLSMSFSFCTAQINWIKESSIWTYNGQGQVKSYIEIAYDKDTLIQSQQAKMLTKKLYTWDNIQNRVVTLNLGTEITYEKDSVIYLYTNSQFDTLCAFNSLVGDFWTLRCYNTSGICKEDARVVVNGTGYMHINGLKLKYINLTYDFGDPFNDFNSYTVEDTMIERIGSKNMYILPWDALNISLDGNEGGRLRCYFDNELGSYSNNFSKPCDFLTTLENEFETLQFKIYPLPCSTFLNVESGILWEGYVVLKDISGRVLLKQKTEGTNLIKLNMMPFSNGVFVLSIFTNNGTYYKKILKI